MRDTPKLEGPPPRPPTFSSPPTTTAPPGEGWPGRKLWGWWGVRGSESEAVPRGGAPFVGRDPGGWGPRMDDCLFSVLIFLFKLGEGANTTRVLYSTHTHTLYRVHTPQTHTHTPNPTQPRYPRGGSLTEDSPALLHQNSVNSSSTSHLSQTPCTHSALRKYSMVCVCVCVYLGCIHPRGQRGLTFSCRKALRCASWSSWSLPLSLSSLSILTLTTLLRHSLTHTPHTTHHTPHTTHHTPHTRHSKGMKLHQPGQSGS